ncbi:MAG: DNA polymerase/3'-5' exonuclease PolX [Gammaproteobacteria bacterium]
MSVHTPIHNEDIAAVFDEIADLLEIGDENPFRVRAYRNAALSLRSFGQDIPTLLKQGEALPKLPGIGKELETKIREIVETGRSTALDELHRQIPAGLAALTRIPGLGPRRVHALHRHLGIETLDQLREAAEQGRIRTLPGFGAKTEARVLEAVRARLDTGRRFRLATAMQYAEPLTKYLQQIPGVSQVVVAGSYRRRMETVGDLDLLATAAAKSPIMERFAAYGEVQEVLSQGPTRSTVILRSGLQVDLRVVPKASFGAALHYFTGSKAHSIAIRRLAQRRGLKINEYGVFRGEKRIAGKTEEEVYRAVGLPCIPPELREDRGEITAARAGRLPALVELAHLRGDLHVHTKASDGQHTLREMALAARDLGLEYLAITEHSQRLTVARGLDAERLTRQMEEIDRLNEELDGITLLKGIEVDILEDGRLDLPDKVLGRLDLVVASVHSHFGLSRERQTERVLRAMDRPHFTLLAHPTGRLLEEREPYDIDLERIIRRARERGCFLELNANPRRLDITDIYCQMAKAEGVLVSINSDAHRTTDFHNLHFGIGQARRGWLEPANVLNTRPLQELRELLRRTM